MAIVIHDEHIRDRAAMVAIRGMMKMSTAPAIAPEGRPGYDQIMARTPSPDGVHCSSLQAAGISGWLCQPADIVPGRVILYFHGGCYVLGSASAYRGLASQIAVRARAAVFVVDYRLAPENPFPAAFDDACAALDGLHAAGYESIAVTGDSAGGGLALALLASGAAATRAVGAAVLSPFVDLSLSGGSIESRAAVDPILSRAVVQQGSDQYLRGADPRNPRVNALSGDLSRLPPVRIDVGDDEILLDDSLRFEAAAKAANLPCEVHVWKGMVHVFPANVAMLKAAEEALDGVGTFLDGLFAQASRV